MKLKEEGDSQELSLHIQMKRLSRMIYPVYVGNVLRAAITFDSTHAGWRPVLFENANTLVPYVLDRQLPSQLGKGWRNYYFASSPDLHDDVIMRHDSTGDYVLPTKELKQAMKENFPGSASLADLTPVKKEDFFEGLKRHIQKTQGRKMQKKH